MQAAMRALMLSVARERHFKALMTTGIGRTVANRFVAGERLGDALRVARKLTAAGARVSIDYLGESVTSLREADQAAAVYRETIAALKDAGIAASISLKPSQFGMDLDYDRCRGLIGALAAACASEMRCILRLDMESSAYTDRTLRLWRDLARDHPNIGIVLQAALRRSAADLESAIAEGASVRLCKGAYAEPPRVAFPRKADVDASYERLMRRLLQAAKELPPMASGNEPRAALATHDQRLIALARRVARRLSIGPDHYEFQMLFGVRRDLQARLLAAGEPLRIYIPWGPAWYPYLSRRLAERPANVVFLGRAIISELLSGHHNGHLG